MKLLKVLKITILHMKLVTTLLSLDLTILFQLISMLSKKLLIQIQHIRLETILIFLIQMLSLQISKLLKMLLILTLHIQLETISISRLQMLSLQILKLSKIKLKILILLMKLESLLQLQEQITISM